jgi:2'-5' RNA ligase
MNQRADGQRLFFALWPDQGAHEALAELRATLRPRVPGRWLSPSSFHLTLAFLGAVAETRLPDVIAVAGSIGLPGFCLELDRWVWWPGPRVLALAPRSPLRELMNLARTLTAGLASIGFEPERRNFRPHLTMARDVRLNPGTLTLARAISWHAGQFCLVASRQTSMGSRYEILQDWSLSPMLFAIPSNQGL